jgi:hypothetical protein
MFVYAYICLYMSIYVSQRSIPVAAWYKVWVWGRSLTETAGSNPDGGTDVSPFSVLYGVR